MLYSGQRGIVQKRFRFIQPFILGRRIALQFARPARCLTSERNKFSNAVENTNHIPVPISAFPESGSTNHHDLPSFLEYAKRTQLDTASTTYVGTHYEYTIMERLKRLGMNLKRIGGPNDCGIDLLGTWTVPSTAQPLKVLIQCKAIARKVDPSKVRELEGAFVGAPQGWRGSGVLGLLVSKKPATKGVREAMGRSRWPMGYVLCGADGKILQMLWNKRVEQEGLEGITVSVRYANGDVTENEVVLIWQGAVVGS